MSESHRTSLAIWMLLIIGSIAAFVVALMAVRAARFDSSMHVATNPVNRAAANKGPAALGTLVKVRAGDIEIERSLPMAAFAIESGQSLDPRVPAGPFECEMTVTFLSGDVREARLGAEIQGGSVIIHPAGRTSTAEDAAGAESRTVMGRDILRFSRAPQQVTYLFRSNGEGPARLRALWQPLELTISLPLPSSGAPLLSDDSLAGMALVQQFNCAACHRSANDAMQTQLDVAPGPVLGDAGARLRPNWIRQWLENPAAMKHGTIMPTVMQASDEVLDDLAHFLVSMGGPIDAGEEHIDADLSTTGMITYHTVGCFTCHGPLEPIENLPGDRTSVAIPLKSYEPPGDVATKTTPAHLAAFLHDPLNWRPSARMPGQNLSPLEAEAIAAYLFTKSEHSPVSNTNQFQIDWIRVERGRDYFASMGCANCHQLGPDRPAIESTLRPPTLESLATSEARGCLSQQATDRAPQFTIDDRDRKQILAFLRSLGERRCDDVPIDRLASGMSRLNCTACHRYHGERGPERAISQYFKAVAEADLGDEGRVPPNLSDVGAKLNPLWMHEVIAEGAVARPYMGVRMPSFGENIALELSHAFASASGVPAEPDDGPSGSPEYASAGRDLIGSKGMACIQCHTIAGHDATGTPGPDLVQAPQRLRYENFARWVHVPAQIRPGTRMPTFFSSGVSGLTQHFDGDAEQQIAAMWAYLSQGLFLPLPEGLVDAAGLELSVTNEPVVFRTFLDPAGYRAIACGFPEQIHCAFDAENCRLAAIWTGAFLNAKGAWAARGGFATNPTRVEWTAPNEPVIQITGESADAFPKSRFRGYELDAERRPVFMYDVSQSGIALNVREQPLPARKNGAPAMIRRFVIDGPANHLILLLGREVTLNERGRLETDVEVTW